MIRRGTLALFQRALRMDARYARGHFVRFLFGLLMFAALCWAHVNSLSVAAPGLEFFRAMALLNAGFILLAGISIFATPITEEKEEGTLGLLKMAGISQAGILLGKSTSRIVICLLLLIVQIPFTMLAITLGGITLSQIFSAYLLLAALMLVVANVGLFCSVYGRRSGTAAGLTASVLIAQFLISPLLLETLKVGIKQGIVHGDFPGIPSYMAALESILDFSIFTRLELIFAGDLAGAGIAQYVWLSLLMAAGLFALSWGLFDLLTVDTQAEGPSRLVPIRRSRKSRPPLGRAWRNMIAWKEFHFGTGGWTFLLVKIWFYAMVVLIDLLVVSETLYPWEIQLSKFKYHQWHDFGSGVMVITAVAAIIELSLYATCLFRDEIRWHTLGPMLMLPRSLIFLAYSKVAGCFLTLIPVALAFTAGAFACPACFIDAMVSPQTWGGIASVSVFLHTTVLVSLYVRWGSLSLSLALVLVFGTFCGMPLVAVPMAMTSSLATDDAAAMLPIAYFGLGMTALLQFLIALRLRAVAAD